MRENLDFFKKNYDEKIFKYKKKIVNVKRYSKLKFA
jgi:hypothetical protein